MGKRSKKAKKERQRKAIQQYAFLFNVEWIDAFLSDDDDHPTPIGGSMEKKG